MHHGDNNQMWGSSANVNWTEARLQQEIAEYEARIAAIGRGHEPEAELTRTYFSNVLERRRKMLAALLAR
jgi:hypothetical protein